MIFRCIKIPGSYLNVFYKMSCSYLTEFYKFVDNRFLSVNLKFFVIHKTK